MLFPIINATENDDVTVNASAVRDTVVMDMVEMGTDTVVMETAKMGTDTAVDVLSEKQESESTEAKKFTEG